MSLDMNKDMEQFIISCLKGDISVLSQCSECDIMTSSYYLIRSMFPNNRFKPVNVYNNTFNNCEIEDKEGTKYLKIPIDSEGQPCYPGDLMVYENGKKFTVSGIGCYDFDSNGCIQEYLIDIQGNIYFADECWHSYYYKE